MMIKKIYKFIWDKLGWFVIGGIALAGTTDVLLQGDQLTTDELIARDGIEVVLHNKTAKERAKIKSKELAKVEIGKYTKDDLEIKIIGDIKEIEVNGNHGIELFASAKKNGKQLGFGKDGTVEIERFRIFNPPVLVDDKNGDIIREWTDDITRETKQRKLKYDPEQAIKESLSHTIGLVGKDGKNIVKGKVGNTTSTFYSYLTYDIFKDDSTSWNVTHDASTGSRTRNGATSTETGTGHSGTGTVELSRLFLYFDTSGIGGSDTIDSVTLGLTANGRQNADNDGNDFMSVVQVQGNNVSSDDSVATSDYDLCGDAIDNPTEAIDSGNRIDIGNADVGGSNYNNFPFNTTGKNFVARNGEAKPSGATNGITYLGIREGHDILDDPISDSTNDRNRINFLGQDQTGTSKDPKLVVEHSAATVETNQQNVIWFQ